MKEIIPFLCPRCKSEKWRKVGEDSSSGYSFGKATAGALLFGPIGAVAGINGKNKKNVTYKCEECGYSQSFKQ